MHHRLLGIALASALFICSRASAQACLGVASFKAAPVRLGASATFGTGYKTVDGGFSAGAPASAFVGMSVGRASYDGGLSSTLFGGSLGFEIPVVPSGRASLCPIGGISYEAGPNALGIKTHGLSFGGGVALGGAIAIAPTVDLAPYGAFSYNGYRVTASDSFESITATTSYGALSFGVGFIFNQRVTLGAGVSIPVGLEGSDPSFSIGISFGLGGK